MGIIKKFRIKSFKKKKVFNKVRKNISIIWLQKNFRQYQFFNK